MPVQPDLVRAAMERTGIDDPEELVEFAVKLLLEPDPSADYSRRTRGGNPGFDLDLRPRRLSLGIAAPERRFKLECRFKRLRVRPGDKLVRAEPAADIRRVLTNMTVYVHKWGDRLPKDAADLIDGVLRFHSSLCGSEIMLGLDNYHPDSTDYEAAWQHYGAGFSDIPREHLLTADSDAVALAGVIAGILARM